MTTLTALVGFVLVFLLVVTLFIPVAVEIANSPHDQQDRRGQWGWRP